MLLADRGDCSFIQKSALAEKSHAKMLIIMDNSDEDLENIIISDDLSGHQLNIPVVVISRESGLALKELLKRDNRK